MKKWKPKEHLEKYYTINIDKNTRICISYFEDDLTDRALIRTDNCFRTRKEAEQKLKEIKLILKK